MFWDFIYKVGRVTTPVLIHFLAGYVVNMLSITMGLPADAALLTSITAVCVLPLFVYMLKSDRNLRGEKGKGEISFRDGVLIAAAAVLANYLLSLLISRILMPFSFSNKVQESLFAGNLVIQFLGLGIVVPIGEEVLFRGLVYNRLRDYNKEWLSALLAAAFFAVYHGNIIQGLFAFPMGLILIGVYRKCNTLKGPIIFHMAVNISSLLAAAGISMIR